jgi:hypothetical protein
LTLPPSDSVLIAWSSSLSDWGLISMCQQFCCGLSS